ncbi:MAG: transglycosylase SLT domain-containing protein [Desulfuromonadaceae bacterium]
MGAEGADCAVYKHVDAEGRVHFSNVPVQSGFTFYCTEASDSSLETASINTLVAHYARKHRLDPDLVKAVMRAESNFDPGCVSSAGARGLMQVMPATAAEIEIYDLFDPSQNIAAGSRYLRQMFERFSGNLDLALAAYNAGPAVVERYSGVPPYAETRMYLKNVKKYFNQYRRISEER